MSGSSEAYPSVPRRSARMPLGAGRQGKERLTGDREGVLSFGDADVERENGGLNATDGWNIDKERDEDKWTGIVIRGVGTCKGVPHAEGRVERNRNCDMCIGSGKSTGLLAIVCRKEGYGPVRKGRRETDDMASSSGRAGIGALGVRDQTSAVLCVRCRIWFSLFTTISRLFAGRRT